MKALNEGESRLSPKLSGQGKYDKCLMFRLVGCWANGESLVMIDSHPSIHIIECRVLPWPTGATNPKVPNSQQNEIGLFIHQGFCWPFEKFLTENVDGKMEKDVGKSV